MGNPEPQSDEPRMPRVQQILRILLGFVMIAAVAIAALNATGTSTKALIRTVPKATPSTVGGPVGPR